MASPPFASILERSKRCKTNPVDRVKITGGLPGRRPYHLGGLRRGVFLALQHHEKVVDAPAARLAGAEARATAPGAEVGPIRKDAHGD
jgi:hypothetical protein